MARRDELVYGVEHGRLVEGEGRRVDRRLGRRVAAVQHEAGQGEAAAAAKARRAVAEAGGDRAEQAEVVEVEDDAGAGVARGLQGPGAEQGVDVVEVGDVGAGSANGIRHLVLVHAAAQQGGRRARSGNVRAVAEEGRVLDAGVLECRELQLHRALLAAVLAVAVVHDEDLHESPRAGSTTSRTTVTSRSQRSL